MKKIHDTIPKIEIICATIDQRALAEEIGYGIEEEGIPSNIRIGKPAPSEAYYLSRNSILGVSIEVHQEFISIFSRLLKEEQPLLKYLSTELKVARIAGKNAARIIKNKPLIDIEDL